MWNIETITAPSVPAVSTEDIRAHLRLNTSAEDTLLADWITAATEKFTHETGYVLTSGTYRLRLDGWPDHGMICIPRHPITSVTSVQYLDTAGSWQTVSSGNYATDLSSVPARIVFSSGYSLPELHETAVPKVRVQFVAGVSQASALPRLATQAIKLLASHWYTYREAFGTANLTETPAGWKAVVNQFKTGLLDGGN